MFFMDYLYNCEKGSTCTLAHLCSGVTCTHHVETATMKIDDYDGCDVEDEEHDKGMYMLLL